MPAVAAIVLDMDGLMLDTEPIYKRAWQRAAAELGHVLDDAGYARYLGRSTEDAERDLAERLGPTFVIERFHDRWPILWREEAAHGLMTKPGLHELLAFADARGLGLAVATSSDREFTRFTLQHGGLADRFGIVVTGDEIAHGKPAPDIYLEAARRLECDPRHVLALEDSDAGILAASRASMRAVMVPDLKPPSPEAAAAAFRIVRSLADTRELIASLLADAER